MDSEAQRSKIFHQAEAAKKASRVLQTLSTEQKNKALQEVHQKLIEKKQELKNANSLDLENAKEAMEKGNLSDALYKRLDLFGKNDEKFQSMLNGLLDVIKLEDPIGQISSGTELDDGLNMYKITCPIGVICVIFEARPEVNIQISSLALKSGNAVILKGGSEASNSNQILIEIFREAISKVKIPGDAVQFVQSREAIKVLLELNQFIDLIIPRGSADLVRQIQSSTRIPVLGHADGICSVYLDKFADLKKAIGVAVDSKINYPAACNSAETLIVHKDILSGIFKEVGAALIENGVRLKVEREALEYLQESEMVSLADPQDFGKEFLCLEMAVKVVNNISEAISFINNYGSHHTDSIVTENQDSEKEFINGVDSAGVYVNASTRFADGFRYGFGAEIGVSTSKMHPRGPVGLEGIVSYKYCIKGSGHQVATYSSNKRSFTHKPIENPLSHFQNNK